MEIMDIEKEPFSNSGNTAKQRFNGHIEFINASFKYGETLENVFENINLDVPAGTSISLVGSSGVGKTTLCSLIPRFYELNSGKILIDGRDIREIDLETLRQNIGVVAQDVYLFNGTVMENIAYGKPSANHEEIIQAAKMAKAHDFIMELPDTYETKIGQRGICLSGGQRQRLSIARAFLKDPPVLILDEATSALDYENENAIHESLDSFIKNRTVFIIAHRLSTVKKAGKVYRLSEHGIEETSNYGDDDVV
jgi:ATP-binding cassette, subfamily B, bacterial